MPKTSDRQIVNGETFMLMDSAARKAISEEEAAREELASEIGDINQVIGYKNLFDILPFTDGLFIRSQDGASRDVEGWKATAAYYDVQDKTSVTVSVGLIVYFYDESKVYLEFVENEKRYDLPTGTKYIRFCCLSTLETAEAILYDANGRADMFFDGTGAEFMDESIPGEAVKNYTQNESIMNSILNAKDIIEGKFTNGTYIRTQDGAARSNDGYKATLDYIDISGVAKIFLTAGEYAAYYNAETTFIECGAILDEIRWEDVPSGAKYIRVTSRVLADAHVYAKNSSGEIYTEFNPKDVLSFRKKVIPFSAVDAEGTPATLPPDVKMVAPSGGDYASIIDANAQCDGTYSIVVLPGEYEGGWQAGDDTYGYKSTKKSYIGLDRNDCIAVRYGAAYAEDVFHTNGKTYMKNLSLKAKKSPGAVTCGYALHLDNGWLTNGKAVFEDCYFSSEGRAAAGIGTRPNCDLVFRNCIFETSYNGNGAVFFHSDPNDTGVGNQRITFENCIFHSKDGIALYIGEIGDDNNEIVLTMINCTLYSDTLGAGDDIVTVDKESYTGSGNGNVTLTAWSHGNNIDIAGILSGE